MPRPSPPRLCALVRFVHSRCGLSGLQEGARGGLHVVDSARSIQELQVAIQASRPAVLRPASAGGAGALDDGMLPAECVGRAGGPSDLMPRLRNLCGGREVIVRLPQRATAEGAAGGLTFGDARARAPYRSVERRSLASVIDEFDAAAAGSSAAGCYVANVPIERELPEFGELLRPFSEEVLERLGPHFGPAVPGTPALYLGSGSQRTPLHFDPTENITTVLQGIKHFRLFPPQAWPYLRPRGGMLAAAVCWLHGVVPAVYSGFDAWVAEEGCAAQPWAVDTVVKAGELLYLPPGWWHAVAGSAEPNVTVVFGFAPSEEKVAASVPVVADPSTGSART